MVFTAYVLCNLRLFKLKTKGKQYKQNILLRSYKNEINTCIPGLA